MLHGHETQMDLTSTHKCLETDAVIVGIGNFEVWKMSWVNGVSIHHNVNFKIGRIDAMFLKINTRE